LFRLSFRELASGAIDLLPLFDEPIQIARVDQDASHRPAIVCARTGNADGGNVAAEGRLMDLHTAAAYLGCSYWTLRDLVRQIQRRDGGRRTSR
jgi:hypothetical protein